MELNYQHKRQDPNTVIELAIFFTKDIPYFTPIFRYLATILQWSYVCSFVERYSSFSQKYFRFHDETSSLETKKPMEDALNSTSGRR